MKQTRSGPQAWFATSILLVSAPCVAAFGQTATPCGEGAAADGKPHLHIIVSGARVVTGNITFTLYGGVSALFLKPRGSIALTRVMLHGTTAEACFSVAAPGPYAVAAYHDENNNHHFDKNFLGLPAEGYGFSNDAPTLFGPPSFAAARLNVSSGENRITIRLRY